MILTLLLNLTAYSQVISTQTKKEIVTTLERYPIVLKELKVCDSIVIKQNTLIQGLESQISQYETLVTNKNIQIQGFEQQKKLYKKELKRSKNRNTRNLILGGGALLGVLLLLN